MCVPTDRDEAVIPFADIFATTLRPLQPRRPPPPPPPPPPSPPRPQRIRLLRAATRIPTPVPATDDRDRHPEARVHLIQDFADAAARRHRSTCPDCRSRLRRHPCGQATAMPSDRPGPVTLGVMLFARLFVTLSIALVAVKLLGDLVVPAAGAVSAGRPAVRFHYAPLTDAGGRGGRARRQLPPLEQGNQVIDSIFQIPIGTLNAVGSLIKNARPLVRRTRERIQQYYSGQQQPTPVSQQQQQYYTYGSRPTPVQASTSQYANRPYYTSYYNNNNYNRRKQQRDDPLPQGRHHGHADGDNY